VVLITSFSTGLFAAMLRSPAAVILVAFLIVVAFVAASLVQGASIGALLIAVVGFNAGLISLMVAHLIRAGARPSA
jgi:hypothetical protein